MSETGYVTDSRSQYHESTAHELLTHPVAWLIYELSSDETGHSAHRRSARGEHNINDEIADYFYYLWELSNSFHQENGWSRGWDYDPRRSESAEESQVPQRGLVMEILNSLERD